MKLIGTAIAPRRASAKYAWTKKRLLRWMMATQSPFSRPACSKPAAVARTARRNSPKVVSVSPSTRYAREDAVCAASSRRSFSVFMLIAIESFLPGIEDVAHGVAQQVPAEHEQEDGPARDEDRVPELEGVARGAHDPVARQRDELA